MLARIIIVLSMLFFVVACGTAPKDTASSSDSGLTSVDYTSDGIKPGSSDDLIVNVGDRVFFALNSHDLDDDSKSRLQDQASWLKQYSNVAITVEGHCDERGTREYNIALGERRAQSMKNYLIGLGIEAGRISTISYGKERPSVLGSNESAWSQNRRAVAVVN
tara:strand:- start:19195 stop:19683 length:489 start_codon:yes stop_codon:yes gene_type:complete